MTSISPRLRDRVDAAARELSDTADAVSSSVPILASVYDSFGHAIRGSHYGDKRYGGHRLHIEVPAGCDLEISPRLPGDDGPRTVTIIVPSPSQQQRIAKSTDPAH
ncbi:MAG TPA: hypothetical protein VMV10_26090 [Pirellulales bacterium]|nr:hypothetical protein [Pirellulales bacterium]HVB82227.1 hypothetical protein [Candidatus Binataceae bacterium]